MFTRDKNLKETNRDAEWHPRYIDVVACLFICVLMLTPILGSKMFELGPMKFSAAIIVFPFACIFGDILTEVYGFNRTRRIIWMGLICDILLVLFTTIAIHLPPAPEYLGQEAYASVLGSVPRITFASIVAYILNEFTNSMIMSKMKIWSKGDNFPLRAVASTAAAQLVDSVIFFGVAFGGTLPLGVIVNLVLSGWAVKVLYEIVVLPVTTVFVRKLKKAEGIEHFDRQPVPVLKF